MRFCHKYVLSLNPSKSKIVCDERLFITIPYLIGNVNYAKYIEWWPDVQWYQYGNDWRIFKWIIKQTHKCQSESEAKEAETTVNPGERWRWPSWKWIEKFITQSLLLNFYNKKNHEASAHSTWTKSNSNQSIYFWLFTMFKFLQKKLSLIIFGTNKHIHHWDVKISKLCISFEIN